jgi:tetratricopeptide (TPR) repeat protein
MVFLADDLGAWLVGLLADAGRRKLTTFVLGSEQDRALRQAATAAVQLTASELRPVEEEAQHLALVISQVFETPVAAASLAGSQTVLEGMQAAVASQLAVLDEAGLTGIGKSSADVLGIPGAVLAERLTGHLLREIAVRGIGGGPLFPLASQLNDDLTHLQGRRLEDMIGHLATELREALGRLDATDAASFALTTSTHITQHNYFFNSAIPTAEGQSAALLAAQSSALRVFISSASGALSQYWQAAVEICRRLGLVPVYEDLHRQQPAPEEAWRREVDSCDVFVLLLAHSYDSRTPEQLTRHYEMQHHLASSRSEKSLLVFAEKPKAASPPRVDSGMTTDAHATFMDKIKSRHIVRWLTNVEAFREDLILELSRANPSQPRANSMEPEGREPQVQSWIPPPPVFHAVPTYVGSAPFIGRIEYLAKLDAWGRSGDPMMVVEAIGGTGKSALTWQWAFERAPSVVDRLAGRLWWSFYESSASMLRLLQELLAYTSGQPMQDVRRLKQPDLLDQVLASLRNRPYLVVLDGLERLFAAYQRDEPSISHDGNIEAGQRLLNEPGADEAIRRLATASPSKLLFNTRLMPSALLGRFGQRLPGIQKLELSGLTNADTRTLLTRLGVSGSEPAIVRFFGSFDNHPLLVGIVARLIREYRTEPGRFDRWLNDPTAGAALRVSKLDLTQQHTHILRAALDGLQPDAYRLLGWLSVPPGSVSWDVLMAVNPFVPSPDVSATATASPLHSALPPSLFGYVSVPASAREHRSAPTIEGPQTGRTIVPEHANSQDQTIDSTPGLDAVPIAPGQCSGDHATEDIRILLDAALKDLEDRGLVLWDRSANSYDMHPIIRAYVREQLEEADRNEANDRVRYHFQALPSEDLTSATGIEDLHQAITVFRALVGTGHIRDASMLWQTFGSVLLVKLGAYSTIVELLSPLARNGSFKARADLSIAYHLLGRFDEAIAEDTAILASHLQNRDALGVCSTLTRFATHFQETGAILAGTRCVELIEAVYDAGRQEPDGAFYSLCGVQAALRGRTEAARELFATAESIGSIANPWLEEEIRYWRLYLTLVNHSSLTLSDISTAAVQVGSARIRRELFDLRCRFLIRSGRFDEALACLDERERLGGAAGALSAQRALLLALLARYDEAAEAIEEVLSHFTGLHYYRRPHYYIAQALWQLNRQHEARAHARNAYEQAWADGPPYSHHWNLIDAHELLLKLKEPAPELPRASAASVTVPLESRIRPFIANMERQANA